MEIVLIGPAKKLAISLNRVTIGCTNIEYNPLNKLEIPIEIALIGPAKNSVISLNKTINF